MLTALRNKEVQTDCLPSLPSGWFRETLWQLPGVMMCPGFLGFVKEHQGKLKCEARAQLLTGVFVALLLENANVLNKVKFV